MINVFVLDWWYIDINNKPKENNVENALMIEVSQFKTIFAIKNLELEVEIESLLYWRAQSSVG